MDWHPRTVLIATKSHPQGDEKASRHDKDGSVIKLVGHDGNIIEKNLGEDTVQLIGVSVPYRLIVISFPFT